jgi:cell division protein ZapA
MEAGGRKSTSVQIFGNVYQIKGDVKPEYLLEVARYVDEKMREIGTRQASASTTKLAILVALHIADELFGMRRAREELVDSANGRVDRLAARLREARS